MGEGEFYELEYLIHGKNQDRDNLSGVVSRLVALRQGLNLIHILSDSGNGRKRGGWPLLLWEARESFHWCPSLHS